MLRGGRCREGGGGVVLVSPMYVSDLYPTEIHLVIVRGMLLRTDFTLPLLDVPLPFLKIRPCRFLLRA
jgi:hypothetical protein